MAEELFLSFVAYWLVKSQNIRHYNAQFMHYKVLWLHYTIVFTTEDKKCFSEDLKAEFILIMDATA